VRTILGTIGAMLAIFAVASGNPLELPASLPGAATALAEYGVGLSENDPVMFAAA
jgi:hypothetical protein